MPESGSSDGLARQDMAEPDTADESTQMIYGFENVSRQVLCDLSATEKTLDLCGDSKGPSIVLANKEVHNAYLQLRAKGVRIRHIIDITKDNLPDSKKMIEFSEVRHVDGLKGYFGIADSKIFASFAIGEGREGRPG